MCFLVFLQMNFFRLWFNSVSVSFFGWFFLLLFEGTKRNVELKYTFSFQRETKAKKKTEDEWKKKNEENNHESDSDLNINSLTLFSFRILLRLHYKMPFILHSFIHSDEMSRKHPVSKLWAQRSFRAGKCCKGRI